MHWKTSWSYISTLFSSHHILCWSWSPPAVLFYISWMYVQEQIVNILWLEIMRHIHWCFKIKCMGDLTRVVLIEIGTKEFFPKCLISIPLEQSNFWSLPSRKDCLRRQKNSKNIPFTHVVLLPSPKDNCLVLLQHFLMLSPDNKYHDSHLHGK